jgi:hypothetical protein
MESDTDLGTVASVISSGVQIEWDSGTTNVAGVRRQDL